MLDEGRRTELEAVLTRARELGLLGPGPVADHVAHSLAFVEAWSMVCAVPPATILDLGSGGGVPGLVVAMAWPACQVLLLDGSERRTAFLRTSIGRLDLTGHVEAVALRAEEAGRSFRRGAFELVTARAFGAPAVTAECGAPLLRPDGILAVAEPPGGDRRRWPDAPLAQLGLEAVGLITQPATVQILRRTGQCPDRYPRRVGIPAKRPLWA